MGVMTGTRTEKNLLKAFEAESKAAMFYRLFADESEYEYLEKIFMETAKNEEEHAETFLEILGIIGDDKENLKRAIAMETFESQIDYPEMARIAKEEGFEDVSLKFEIVAKIEELHKKKFQYMLDILMKDRMYKRDKKVLWECMKCGYVYEGLETPEECPFCGHGKDDFMIREWSVE